MSLLSLSQSRGVRVFAVGGFLGPAQECDRGQCVSVPLKVFSRIGNSSRSSGYRGAYHLSTPHFYLPSDPLLPHWIIWYVLGGPVTDHTWAEDVVIMTVTHSMRVEDQNIPPSKYISLAYFELLIPRDCRHGSGSESLLFHEIN